MKIGVYDSGLGGLSVLHDALCMLPDVQFVYYADQDHVPYGEKTDDELRRYVQESIAFLIDQNVDGAIIACNTATTVATKEFRSTLPIPVVGMEPAVKVAIDSGVGACGRILLAATPVTIRGDKLHHLLGHVDMAHEVDLIALPRLVEFAEQGCFNTPEVRNYLSDCFSGLNLSNYAGVVLGCTHFDYFRPAIASCLNTSPDFFNGNEGTIRQLVRLLSSRFEKQCCLRKDVRLDAVASDINVFERVVFYSSGKTFDVAGLTLAKRCMQQLDHVNAS